eukprot:7026076-Pyramimonas_sp.AAC.1
MIALPVEVQEQFLVRRQEPRRLPMGFPTLRGESAHALVHLRGATVPNEPLEFWFTPDSRPPRILDHPGATA